MREPASPSLLSRVRMRWEEGHLETLDLGPPSFQNGEKYAFVVQATQSMIICNSSLNCGNLSYRYIASPHEACCTRYGQSFTYVSMLTASQQRHTLLSLFYWREIKARGVQWFPGNHAAKHCRTGTWTVSIWFHSPRVPTTDCSHKREQAGLRQQIIRTWFLHNHNSSVNSAIVF